MPLSRNSQVQVGMPLNAAGFTESMPDAGQTTVTDLEGNDIAGKFEEQARTIFALLNRTLERAGNSLANLVTMTVFINDARNGDRFVQIRREHFPDGRYPCSALLTISGFARPGIMIEIQGVAVI